MSPRLRAVVDALPLRPGLRVIEVGGAPGATAREVARRVGRQGHVLILDRSSAAVAATERACAEEIAAGTVSVRLAGVETATLLPDEPRYDLAFACRVGVLDGRHPEGQGRALAHLREMLVPGGPVLVDTGDPLRDLTRQSLRPPSAVTCRPVRHDGPDTSRASRRAPVDRDPAHREGTDL